MPEDPKENAGEKEPAGTPRGTRPAGGSVLTPVLRLRVGAADAPEPRAPWARRGKNVCELGRGLLMTETFLMASFIAGAQRRAGNERGTSKSTVFGSLSNSSVSQGGDRRAWGSE